MLGADRKDGLGRGRVNEEGSGGRSTTDWVYLAADLTQTSLGTHITVYVYVFWNSAPSLPTAAGEKLRFQWHIPAPSRKILFDFFRNQAHGF